MRTKVSKLDALIMNLGAVVCWALAPIMIRAAKEHFSVLFQSLFRYFVSLAILWPFSILRYGVSLPRFSARIALIAVVNYLFQITFTFSLFLLYPGVVSLLNQTGILFSVGLTFLLFPDEGPALRSWRFFLGLALALAGVAATVVGGRDWGRADFSLGVAVILFSAASWSLLSALVKKWLPELPATLALASVFTLVVPMYLVTWLAWEGPRLPQAPPGMWLLLLSSGLIGIGAGHLLFYRSVPVLGIALSSSLGLLIPLLVGVLSAIIFGEAMTSLQLAGGTILIAGCYLIIRARFPEHVLKGVTDENPDRRR